MFVFEEKLRNSQAQKIDLEKKIRELETRQKKQQRNLDRVMNQEDFQKKQRGLLDELRVWREKVRKVHEQQESDERNKRQQ